MDKEYLQQSLKSALEQADRLEADVKAENREPTDAEMRMYESFVNKAEGYKSQIDNLSKREKISEWAGESSGSAVKSSFDRIAFEGEGEIPGVTSTASGELYAVDGAYKGVGERKLQALKSGAYKDAVADYIRMTGLGRTMKGDAMKVLSEGTDPSGGFWIPPDYRPELIKRMSTMATVRPNASVYTTGTDGVTFPASSYTDDDKYTSGVRFSWRASSPLSSDIAEATNPVAGQQRIPVHLATAAIIATREQLEDNSFDLLGYINELLAESFALGEEDAFTNGDGVGKPVGFMQHPSASIANGSTGTVAGVTYSGNMILSGAAGAMAWGNSTTGILGTESSMPPQYEGGAMWYGTKATFASIRALNTGTANLPQWSLGDSYPNYANNHQASLLGYGVQKNQFMPAVSSTTTPLILANMKGYRVVDRVGLSIEVFREVYGLRDQVVIYARKRTGGLLTDYWKFKYMKSNNT